jgi:hypothetical protein
MRRKDRLCLPAVSKGFPVPYFVRGYLCGAAVRAPWQFYETQSQIALLVSALGGQAPAQRSFGGYRLGESTPAHTALVFNFQHVIKVGREVGMC